MPVDGRAKPGRSMPSVCVAVCKKIEGRALLQAFDALSSRSRVAHRARSPSTFWSFPSHRRGSFLAAQWQASFGRKVRAGRTKGSVAKVGRELVVAVLKRRRGRMQRDS